MTATVKDDVHAPAPGGVRVVRIVTGAILLEVALFAVLVPLGVLVGARLMGGPGGPRIDPAFFAVIALACAAFGYVAGRLVVRGVASHVVMHGFLTGVIATALYVGICAVGSTGLSGAVAAYGTVLFWTINLLRIVGTTAGAAHARRS